MRYLDILPLEIRDLRCEATRIVDGTWRHVLRSENAMRNSNAMIVVTKCRCLVNDTSAFIGLDVLVVENSERPILELYVQ